VATIPIINVMIPEKGESRKRLIVMTKDLGKRIKRIAASRRDHLFFQSFKWKLSD